MTIPSPDFRYCLPVVDMAPFIRVTLEAENANLRADVADLREALRCRPQPTEVLGALADEVKSLRKERDELQRRNGIQARNLSAFNAKVREHFTELAKLYK